MDNTTIEMMTYLLRKQIPSSEVCMIIKASNPNGYNEDEIIKQVDHLKENCLHDIPSETLSNERIDDLIDLHGDYLSDREGNYAVPHEKEFGSVAVQAVYEVKRLRSLVFRMSIALMNLTLPHPNGSCGELPTSTQNRDPNKESINVRDE